MDQEKKTTPKKPRDNRRKPVHRRKHKYASSVGALFVVFAIVGVIAVALATTVLTRRILDNSSSKQSFEKIIQPVAMFDPVPFESAKDIDNQQLLFYSMWSILADEKVKEYEKNEALEILIPASDLDAAAHSLFGDSVTLTHKSFGDDYTTYNYDRKNATYNIPPYGSLYVYTPEVMDIQPYEDNKDIYLLRVGYHPPPDAWSTIYAGGLGNQLDKTMIYVMQRAGDSWRLIRVMDDPDSIRVIDPNMPGMGITAPEQPLLNPEDYLSSSEDTGSSSEVASSSEGDTSSSEGDTSSSEGDTSSSEGDTSSSEGDTSSSEGDTSSSEGDTSSSEGDTSSSEGDTSSTSSN